VKLDYSNTALGVLGVLVREYKEQPKNKGKSKIPWIEALVPGKFTVAANSK